MTFFEQAFLTREWLQNNLVGVKGRPDIAGVINKYILEETNLHHLFINSDNMIYLDFSEPEHEEIYLRLCDNERRHVNTTIIIELDDKQVVTKVL